MAQSGQNQGAMAHVQAQLRQQTRDQVRERFARYGDKTCARIVEAAVIPNGLRRLMERVGLPACHAFEQQMEYLARYLSEFGSKHFLSKMETLDHNRRRLYEAVADHADQTPVEGPTAERPKAATPSGAGPNATTPKEWFDTRGRYVGPERRKVSDRRTGDDRRDRLDSISKNKRFGGDRRKEPRRRDDRLRVSQEHRGRGK
jgi:hypothetical protein